MPKVKKKKWQESKPAHLSLSCVLPAAAHYLLDDHMAHACMHTHTSPLPAEPSHIRIRKTCLCLQHKMAKCYPHYLNQTVSFVSSRTVIFASSLKKTTHSSEHATGTQYSLDLHGNSQKKEQLCPGSEHLIRNPNKP